MFYGIYVLGYHLNFFNPFTIDWTKFKVCFTKIFINAGNWIWNKSNWVKCLRRYLEVSFLHALKLLLQWKKERDIGRGHRDQAVPVARTARIAAMALRHVDHIQSPRGRSIFRKEQQGLGPPVLLTRVKRLHTTTIAAIMVRTSQTVWPLLKATAPLGDTLLGYIPEIDTRTIST